jgi:hypothetical protein
MVNDDYYFSKLKTNERLRNPRHFNTIAIFRKSYTPSRKDKEEATGETYTDYFFPRTTKSWIYTIE